MKLNDDHVAVLMEVRSRIEDAEQYAECPYICIHISNLLVHSRHLFGGRFSALPFSARRDMQERLSRAIHVALHLATVKSYLYGRVPGFTELAGGSPHLMEQYAWQARLAWLDKMIETRKIG